MYERKLEYRNYAQGIIQGFHLFFIIILSAGLGLSVGPVSRAEICSITPVQVGRSELLYRTVVDAAKGNAFQDKILLEDRSASREHNISPEQAIALAINRLKATAEGYQLRHPRHTVTFRAEGLHFVPRRGGPDWQWRLTHVGITSRKIAEVEVGRVEPINDAPGVVSYRRGGLVEQYLMRAKGIEQQFVIPQPLALQEADLVITGAVRSRGTFEATPQGWLWWTTDGVVSLGNVRVVDADGVEIPAEMEVRADGTRIVVDGSALARAAYPVVIDPEIGTNDFRISDMGPDGNPSFGAFNPAVAYNSTNNEYLVVWSGDDNTPPLVDDEFEIFGQRINASTGAEIGVDFRISDMGPDGNPSFGAFNPAVAYNSTNNEYLVVWSGDDNTPPLVDDEFEIFGQRINASTGAEIGVDFRISDMGPDGNPSFGAFNPAVAYNSTNNEYLVVWSGDDNTPPLVDDEFEIFGQRIAGATGAEVGTNDFRISDMGPDGNPSFGAFNPAVAYNSTNNQYLVVWSGDDNTPPLVDDEFEIFGQRIAGATGAEVGTNDFRISDMGPDGNPSFGAFNLAVAYNSTNNQYLVAWYGDDNTPPLVDDEFEIFGQRIAGATGAEIGVDFRISDMGPDGNPSFGAFNLAVAYNSTNNEYLVAWYGDDNTPPLVDDEFEIFGQRIAGATGAEVGTNDFRISDMGPDGNPSFGAFNPAVAYNSTNNEYLVVWSGDDNTPPLVDDEFEIFGQRLEFVPPTVIRVNSVADTGDGILAEGEMTAAAITQLLVTFSKSVQDPPGNTQANDVTNPANYRLFTAGPNNTFQTTVCGPAQGDDGTISINSVTYNDITRTATLNVNGGITLPADNYRLLVCGSTSIQDLDGTPLDGNGDGIGGDDFVRSFSVVQSWGIFGDIPVPGDYDGDNQADLVVWRGSVGMWFLLQSSAGLSIQVWGLPGDKPVPGDYDQDGLTDIAVWRPFTGTWFILNSTGGIQALPFGRSTDLPVPGDYDADGITDIAIFRPSVGGWGIKPSGGGDIIKVKWGLLGDIPVPGDYDGDGKTDMAVWRPIEGVWYILLSSGGFQVTQWGLFGDTPVPEDYDGDGKTDIAIWRGSEGRWYIILSSGGLLLRDLGSRGDTPVAADYNGDGKAELAVWRPTSGAWFILFE